MVRGSAKGDWTSQQEPNPRARDPVADTRLMDSSYVPQASASQPGLSQCYIIDG